MQADADTTAYRVRGTRPDTAEQVAFECESFAMAHAKVAELRMGGYKDVAMSLAESDDNRSCES